MPPRETFILCQDIAPGQVADFHPKPGSNLEKLVNKKVIDTFFVNGFSIPVPTNTARLDQELLDQVPATGLTAIGILTDRRHEIFIGNTDDAIKDSFGNEVTVQMVTTPSLNFTITMTTGSFQGTTIGNPGDVQIGDYVRIQGQGTVAPYFSRITNKVPFGSNFVLTFQNQFLQGITQAYVMERVTRWEATFLDSTLAPYVIPSGIYELGFFKRVYLADVTESFGTGPIDFPELTPEAGVGVPGPPGSPFSSSIVEVILDPGESFLWFHGLMTDIPLLTWWVEWPGYPTCRYYYGMQSTPSMPFAAHVDCLPTLGGTFPVDFKFVDSDSILITNHNSVDHRVKAIVFKPM